MEIKKILNLLNKNSEIIFLIFFLVFLLSTIFVANIAFRVQDIFPNLAWSFLHGKTYFYNEINNPDIIFYQSQYYWHMPPLPAVILIPVVFIFNGPVHQGAINIILHVILFLIIYYFCCLKFNFSKTDSLWLAILYLFSSVFISSMVLIESYFYAQIITTLLLFLSLIEIYSKKRYWLIGIYFALILLTRYTAALTILFFILILIFSNITPKNKVKKMAMLFVPIFMAIIILGLYNYLRFEQIFINSYQLTSSYIKDTIIHPYGLFDLRYIPTNFYYYFLEGFTPILKDVPANIPRYILKYPYITINKLGATSFFLISPLFLLLYKADWTNAKIKYALITSGIILLILLSYFYNGHSQIGPRYLNDILPLLFLILLYIFQKNKLNYKHKLVIFFSVILNIYLWFTLIKPLLN